MAQVPKYIFENGIMRLNPQWVLIHEKAAGRDFTGIEMDVPSMLQGDTSKPPSTISNPSMNVGSLITGNNLLKDQANINYATDSAQAPYLPGQQDILVDGAPVANPDFGREAPDLGPNIAEQFVENMESGEYSSFLQTKENARQKVNQETQDSGNISAGMGQLSSAAQGMAAQMSDEDPALSGGLSGLSTGLSTAAGLHMLGVGGLTTGVGAATALTPLGIGVIAGSAVLGAIMSSKKAKKAREAAAKAKKEKEKLLHEAKISKAYTNKMNLDAQAYDNLQRAVSSALRRDNQIKIRT